MSHPDGESEVMKLKARLYDVQCENAELGMTINQLGKELTEKKTLLAHAMAHIEKEAGRMYEVQRETSDLRERLELTTKQLEEARTLLARAMEHIEKQTENERARLRLSSFTLAPGVAAPAPTSPRPGLAPGVAPPAQQRQPSPAPVASGSQLQNPAVAAIVSSAGNRLSEPILSRAALSPASPRLGHRRSEPIHPPPAHPPPPRPVPVPAPGPSTTPRPTTLSNPHPRPPSAAAASPPPQSMSPRPGGRQEQIRRMRSRTVTLTREDLSTLAAKREPQRYHEWLARMFVCVPDAECPQEVVWNLYRDTFSAFAPRHPLLAAADVINLIPEVYPETRNLVIEDPHRRYIVRGLDRRKEVH